MAALVREPAADFAAQPVDKGKRRESLDALHEVEP